MTGICMGCNKEKYMYCQKRMLCNTCYALWYREHQKNDERKKPHSRYLGDKIHHSTEIEFIKNFFEHKNWIYQPAFFRLNGGGYSPDFYDGERNIFIEVSGTHQAFCGNKKKYIEFMKTYPKVNFEIRYSTGELLKDMKFHIPEKR